MSARNRELLGLLPASLLITAGFAGVFIQRKSELTNVSLTYGAIFLGLCLAAHVFIRITLPYADPYLFPLVAVLASFGLVMIYRISSDDARQQAQWFVIGLLLFAATVILFRDYRKLEQYRYVIVSISLVLLILPRVPGLGEQVNGAYLGIRIPGTIGFQPTEFSKVGLVIFLASYLRDTRQVMVQGARRVLGVTIPPLKHFGPVLVIWGMAMVILFLLSDIGSSLMFYGALLAMLYVATGRLSFVVVGPGRVRARRLVSGHAHPARPRALRGLAAPVQAEDLQRRARQLPARQRPVRPGGGRRLRSGLRPVDPHHRERHAR